MSVVARARAAIGTRFRLHGRGGDGLDCVGLAGLAYGVAVPTGYPLRTADIAAVARVAEAAGLTAAHGDAGAGDLLAMTSGPGQLHLAIVTDTGFVHADASLRRVVERPGTPPWPVVGHWRKED
ncbi:MAG: peptidoglycan endopeptidase [Pseudomonadota bacterium]